VTNVSLMRLVRREDLPTSSSPQMHIRTCRLLVFVKGLLKFEMETYR
jgi:hypothetical protein